MRFVSLLTFFLSFFNNSFTQDTVKIGKDLIIFKDKKIIQKEFNSSKNYIKIVYQYNEFGVLVRRYWYNSEGKLLSVCLDN